MSITPMNFIYNLKYLLRGELGIFAVLGIMSIAIIIMNKVYDSR